MLMAISVIIGIICKNFFTWQIYYRVTFENFPIIIVGYCFGPVWGAIAGAGADIISCLCSTNPMVVPLITLGAAAVGAVSGIFPIILRKMSPKITLAFSCAGAHLLGQVAIKSLAKVIFLGMPWWGIFLGLAISAAVCPIEYLFIRLLLRNREIKKSLKELSNYELY